METLLIGLGTVALIAFVCWVTGLTEFELRLKFGNGKLPNQLDR